VLLVVVVALVAPSLRVISTSPTGLLAASVTVPLIVKVGAGVVTSLHAENSEVLFAASVAVAVMD
jgi:hypothetical protein